MKIERRQVKDGWIQITSEDERFYLKEDENKYYKSSTWVCEYVPKGKGFNEYLKRMGQEADSYMTERGDIGNKVHGAIHLLVKRFQEEGHGYLDIQNEVFMNESSGQWEPLTGEECEIVLTFVRWWEWLESMYDIIVLGHEETKFNEEYSFAGTRDLRLGLKLRVPHKENKKRKKPLEDYTGTVTIDYKTSKAIYPSHEAQICSYGQFDDSKEDRLFILQIGYKQNQAGWKFTEIERSRFALWIAALVFWNAENANKQPKQFQLPQLLQIGGDKKLKTAAEVLSEIPPMDVNGKSILTEQLEQSIGIKSKAKPDVGIELDNRSTLPVVEPKVEPTSEPIAEKKASPRAAKAQQTQLL